LTTCPGRRIEPQRQRAALPFVDFRTPSKLNNDAYYFRVVPGIRQPHVWQLRAGRQRFRGERLCVCLPPTLLHPISTPRSLHPSLLGSPDGSLFRQAPRCLFFLGNGNVFFLVLVLGNSFVVKHLPGQSGIVLFVALNRRESNFIDDLRPRKALVEMLQ
jgi:hypothetical protein